MSITQFTMEDVRCFSERQTLEIRPLTFLVGENSTGKTTTLACFHVLANYLLNREVDFNVDPYSMGTFKDIVRNSRNRDKVFKLGFTYTYQNENVECTFEFVEKKGGFEPVVNLATMKFKNGEIVFKTQDEPERSMHLAAFDGKQNLYQINCGTGMLDRGLYLISFRSLRDSSLDFLEGSPEGKSALANYLKERRSFIRHISAPSPIGPHMSVFSTFPVRSRPKRTYDPTREFKDPEGSDVPMLLMRTEISQKDNWEMLKQQLVEFGVSSGLFQNIKIKNFGRGGPFQLQFKIRGPNANITDVGYGVSQILPILVHVLNSDTSPRSYKGMTYFLLQQPEVHLHPKAQAEFSSLLAKLANRGNQSFIVETHSDYMIDRARIEIRKGNIRPEDVSIIYFEPKGNIVKAHNIAFDKMGNMESVPPHYRDFFLKESKRLMGFDD